MRIEEPDFIHFSICRFIGMAFKILNPTPIPPMYQTSSAHSLSRQKLRLPFYITIDGDLVKHRDTSPFPIPKSVRRIKNVEMALF